MSHFSTLVLLPASAANDLNKALLAVMQPWHEFECTGTDDQYVVDIDETEEARATYAETSVVVLQDPAGVQHWMFDEAGNYKAEFSEVNPDYPKISGSPRCQKVPEGWQEVKAPYPQHRTFLQFVKDYYGHAAMPQGTLVEGTSLPKEYKYGYAVVDEAGEVVKVVRRTNPNKKWDWFEVGGRYRNRMLDKNGEKSDCCDVEDLDLSALRAANVASRQKSIADGIAELLKPSDMRSEGHPTTEAQVREMWAAQVRAGGWEAVIAAYRAATEADSAVAGGGISNWIERTCSDQPEHPLYPVHAARQHGLLYVFDGIPQVEDLDAWALDAPPLTAWALVNLKGEWAQRGEMGWFGMSTPNPEFSGISWEDHVMITLKEAPAGTIAVYVDCHI